MWRTLARKDSRPRSSTSATPSKRPQPSDVVARLLHAQALRLGDEPRPPARVGEPAARDGAAPGGVAHLEAVRRAATVELEPRDPRAHVELGPGLLVHAPEVGVEARAVDLEGGVEREVHAPDLAHRGERRRLRLVVEEVAQAVLRELLLVQVAREREPPDEVVARELDGRLADPVVALAALLEEGDPEARERAEELAGEEPPRHSAAHDRDVEIGAHGRGS